MDVNESKLNHGSAEAAREKAETMGATEAKEAKKAKKKSTRFWESCFFGLLYALWGYLLGGAALPFHAEPFGVALLCASDRRIPYVYAGLCVAAWQTEERILLIAVYTAAVLVRLLVRLTLDTPWSEKEDADSGEKTLGEIYPKLFSEHIGLRMATSCIAVFAIGLYRLIEGGFLYYDLYGTVLSILAAPTAVLLFTGFFTDKKVGRYRHISGFLSLAFVLIWAAGELRLYGISAAVFGCMFVTLYVSRKQGIVAGMLTGTVCGLAVAPNLAPLFAFGALSAGLLFPVSVFFAAISACSVGVAWGLYADGIGALNGTVPALLASALLFAVLDKLFFTVTKKAEVPVAEIKAETAETAEESAPERVVCMPLPPLELDGVRLMDTNRRIKALCESFSSLSEVFYGLSRNMQTPTAADLRQICDNAFDSSCTGCPDKTRCWGERYHQTSGEVGRISSILHRNGRVERGDVGEELSAACGRLSDIVEEINHNTAQHQKQILQGDRTEIFAMDYEGMADLLAAAMTEQDGAFEIDADLSRRLCEELTELNLELLGACVLNGRKRRVTVCGRDRGRMEREAARITQTVRRLCPFAVEEGIFSEAGDEGVMEFTEAEALSVIGAVRNLCAEGEEQYCGDTAGQFCRSDGRFFAFISDGMGAGREAALTSGISGLFLRKMLGAGNSCETTLRMLNGFLRNRGSGSLHECSATVDLMELDLMRSRASFYKSGAAPTYVFRNGSLFKLRSHTVPVGIIRELDTRKIGFDVSAGDVIVMVSDGVTQGKEECPWLFDLLRSQGDAASADRLADLIVKYAKNEGATDDISVLIIKITEGK